MTPDQLRASDADRTRLAGVLGDHLAAGRLTLAEFDERVAAAYGATTVGDLDALLYDLPAVRAHQAVAVPVGPRTQIRRPVRPLGPEFTVWWRVGALCVAIWLATSLADGGPLYFWPVWVFGPWGVVLLAKVLTGSSCAGARRPG